ncbi:MAG: MarR family transcriptional regulator [Eubacteriales bacterium]|nr:MarR family transcriptional regulator [Eubacteriales bacterium]
MSNKEELFFVENLNPDNIFQAMERADFVYLYYIDLESKNNTKKVYLSTLAERLHQPMNVLSKGMKRLQDKGYVEWKLDHVVEKTYVELTITAIELLASQESALEEVYRRLHEKFSEEELGIVTAVMKEARKIAREVTEK